MICFIRTTSTDPDFISLVNELDAELRTLDPDYDSFYVQFNNIDVIPRVVIAYDTNEPVACGGIKAFGSNAMEVKRMYTKPSHRGKGIAANLLSELEKWSAELGMKKCVLETGTMLAAAIKTYEKSGYERIPNYGQYEGQETSVCFEKQVDRKA